jgi:hypothetical protein
MRLSTFFATAIGIGAAMAFSAAAHAQKHEITADEVKNYFSQVQRDATEFVHKGDVEGIGQWSDRNVADSASFKILVEAIHENKPKMWTVIDLSKADTQHLKAELGQTVARSIQDYSLRIEVKKVFPHGTDAATVTATWTDSGKLTPPARAAGQAQSTVGQSPQTETQPKTLEVRRTFDCDHVLVREEGRLKIGLSNCRGQVQF